MATWERFSYYPVVLKYFSISLRFYALRPPLSFRNPFFQPPLKMRKHRRCEWHLGTLEIDRSIDHCTKTLGRHSRRNFSFAVPFRFRKRPFDAMHTIRYVTCKGKVQSAIGEEDVAEVFPCVRESQRFVNNPGTVTVRPPPVMPFCGAAEHLGPRGRIDP